MADVLLVVHGVNDGARTKKQQSLEERVREQVEDASAISTRAEGHEHVAKLRARRIGNHTLYVVLHKADRTSEECRGGAHEHHNGERDV